MQQFHKDTFSKITDSKRDRIITTAIKQFAEQGYTATNINHIAKQAGISIGSLYSYFNSKEDLFLAMVEIGVQLLNDAVAELEAFEGSFSDTLERLLELTVRYTKEHPDLTKLYLNLSTEELAPLSERLTERIEISFHGFYETILKRAQDKGEIPPETDIAQAAYFIDNQVMMLQLSLSTRYYAQRLKKYLGEIDQSVLLANLKQSILRSFDG